MRAHLEIDTLLRHPLLFQIVRASLAVVIIQLASARTLLSPAFAQEATPVPVTCDVEPRPVTFIADLLAAPQPEVTPTPVAGIPEGTEVTDNAVRAEIVATVETLIACVNQGEVLRAFALFDDEYLRRLIDPEGLMSADVAIELARSMATPEAVENDEETTLEEILLVRRVDDGTIVVVFRTRGGPDRDPEDTQIDLFVLRQDDGGWTIVDGLSDIDPDSVPEAE